LSIIEAMAKGVPVVATGVDGILELIDDSCAIMLPLGEEEAVAAIADAIERSSRDEMLRMRLATAARDRAEGFRIERAAARYASLLREIVARRPEKAARRYERSIVARGDAIDFSDPARAWNVLQEGWSFSEAEGVWSNGASSTLLLRTDARKGETLRIEFDFSAYLPPACPSQESYVFADDEPIAFWRISAPGWQKRSMDVEVADDCGRVRLRFEHMHATAPAALGASDDARALALFVRRLTVAEAKAQSRVA
jgi:hypothetical protein